MAITQKYHDRTGLSTGVPHTSLAAAFVTGPRQILSGVVTFTAHAYATGGLAADLQGDLGSVDVVLLSPTGGYHAEYDATNKKIKLYSGPGTEVTNATSVTLSVHFMTIGSR